MYQCESLIPLKITTIKSCKCYTDYWKTMKMSTFPYVEFNYSIEKTFSYRKYFYRQDLFYHFCDFTTVSYDLRFTIYVLS